MTFSIQRHKFSEQVKVKHLEHLVQARNANLALKEGAKTVTRDLEGRLKRFEDSHSSMAAQVADRERRIENLSAFLRYS